LISICIHSNGNGKVDANPFDEEEEWDEGDNVLVDNGEPGVPVKALYDYEGAESDELTFKQGVCGSPPYDNLHWSLVTAHRFYSPFSPGSFSGDVFEKLEDEDEQGWCKGRMNDN